MSHISQDKSVSLDRFCSV